MNQEEKIKILQQIALEEMEIDHNVEEAFLIESTKSDDKGILYLDDSIQESCWCEECLKDVLIFQIRDDDLGKILLANYSPKFYQQIVDKTNGGLIQISKLFS